jgi:hypothetical protein
VAPARLLKAEKHAVLARARELAGWEWADIVFKLYKAADGKEPPAVDTGIFS